MCRCQISSSFGYFFLSLFFFLFLYSYITKILKFVVSAVPMTFAHLLVRLFTSETVVYLVIGTSSSSFIDAWSSLPSDSLFFSVFDSFFGKCVTVLTHKLVFFVNITIISDKYRVFALILCEIARCCPSFRRFSQK